MNIHDLKKLYSEGYSLTKLGEKYGKDPRTIKRILQMNGVTIRTRSEQNMISNQLRGLKVDHTYFDQINSNKKAYILGLLAADGSVSGGNRNRISLGLSSVDREILEKIKTELKIEREIEDFITSKGFPVSRLVWSSANQKIKLSSYGIVPNKTYKRLSLKNIPQDFKMSYLLGYYDGDGCFRNDGTTCRMEICAYRPELLNEFAELINERFGSTNTVLKSKSRKNYYTLTYSTKYAVAILNYLYEKNPLFLQRKYNSFYKWKEQNDRI